MAHGGTLPPAPTAEEAEPGRYLRLNGHPSLTGKLQVSKRLSQNKLDKAKEEHPRLSSSLQTYTHIHT